jgi:hypothetical protein
MAEETPPETFLAPMGAEILSAVQDARFTSANGSTESSPLEASCLFFPLTTEAQEQENYIVVDKEEQNVLLDYSSITNHAQPAKEALCLTEVQREEAEVRDTNSSVASHKAMKELKWLLKRPFKTNSFNLCKEKILKNLFLTV